MQTWVRYDMRPKTYELVVYTCQQTSMMYSSPQTCKSLARANVCGGWCICVWPAKCKNGVAPGRCVPPTCAHVNLHHPTHVHKCLHSLLEGMNVNRGMHIRLYTHACAIAMSKGVLTERWWIGGCHQLWKWIECLCVLFKLSLMKIRCHASPYRKVDGSMETKTPCSPILH